MNDKQTTTTALVQAKRTVRDLIESDKTKAEIAKVLPRHLTAERMTRVYVTAIMKNPDLLNCTPASLLNAIMICSQAGLEPDGRLAHLIPYKQIVQVIFDYKGLIALALRNGMESLYGDKVCENDTFRAWVQDGEKKIAHEINWKAHRGKSICYYVVTKRAGQIDWEVMTVEEVEEIRQRSRAKDSGPWVTDYDEMGKKTVIRRMSKRWDLLPEIRDVINADDDTPANFAAPLFKAPLFDSQPKALKTPAEDEPATNGISEPAISEPQNLPREAPEASRSDFDEVPATQTPPKQQNASQAKPENGAWPLKQLRQLMAGSKINPKPLLDYLAAEGATDGNVASLEELQIRFSNIVKVCVSEWTNISGKIKETASR
jgi:recombination protein RecT